MIRLLFTLGLAVATAAAAAPALAQSAPARSAPATAPSWERSGGRIAFAPAGLSFPQRIGTLELAREAEFSRPGEGLDNGLQYRSADGAVFATVYVYLPALAHPGLTAFATDRVIRSSSPGVRGGELRAVAAGGAPGAALRADYSNYRGGNASVAAFTRAGRWQVKLRITGPEARRAEVEGAMAALLDGIGFTAAARPGPAERIAIEPCPAGQGAEAARALPDGDAGEMAVQALLAMFDGAGMRTTDSSGRHTRLPGRVPQRLCLSGELRFGDRSMAVLRAPGTAAAGIDGGTTLIAIIDDSGTMIEMVDMPALRRQLMFYHQIGGTSLLGSYDAPPSDAQLVEMLGTARHDATRIRASVQLRADGNTEIQIPTPAPRPEQAVPVT